MEGGIYFEPLDLAQFRLRWIWGYPVSRPICANQGEPAMTSQPVWAHHGLEHRGAPFLSLAALWASGTPAVWRPLGVPDELVGEEDEAFTDGLGIDEAHGLLVAGLVEEALTRPEHDWEDDQPQLVDQVMLD
jgi:hypothetical protein